MLQEAKGKAKMPEEEPLTERLDFNRPDYSLTPGATHRWRQRGYYIHCNSCELEHGIFIGAEKMLTGIGANGEPILSTRKQLGMAQELELRVWLPDTLASSF